MKNKIFLALLIWLLLGLLLGLDYTSINIVSGTSIFKLGINLITVKNPVFIYQILTFLISVIFILSSYFSVGNNAKLLSVLELSIWVLKLLILKDNYMQGFGGTPDEEVVFYDFVSILLRMMLLNYYFWNGIRIIFALLIASIIIWLKINYFMIPLYHLPI